MVRMPETIGMCIWECRMEQDLTGRQLARAEKQLQVVNARHELMRWMQFGSPAPLRCASCFCGEGSAVGNQAISAKACKSLDDSDIGWRAPSALITRVHTLLFHLSWLSWYSRNGAQHPEAGDENLLLSHGRDGAKGAASKTSWNVTRLANPHCRTTYSSDATGRW